MDQVETEFQAVYRVDEEVEIPEDLYDNISNRNLVVKQIMHRFEDDMKPARHTMIMNIGGELNKYYKTLDKYYELVKPTGSDVDIDDPDYYLKAAEESEHITTGVTKTVTPVVIYMFYPYILALKARA